MTASTRENDTFALIGPLARRVLTAFAETAPAGRRGEEYSIDFGPAVIASLLTGPPAPSPHKPGPHEPSPHKPGPHEPSAVVRGTGPGEPESRALAAWLHQLRAACTHPGLYGWGGAGYLLGLRLATPAWPALAPLAARLRRELAREHVHWHRHPLAWYDYDIVTGTAGTLMVLATDPDLQPGDLDLAVSHLTRLCSDDELTGLRVGSYRDEPMRGWNHGRVNTGVAHGAAGVTLALCAAADATGLHNPPAARPAQPDAGPAQPDAGPARPDGRPDDRPADRLATALTRLSRWLTAQSRVNDDGMITWPQAGDMNRLQRRPQAWCYGTPGVSWALWEAGRILGDDETQRFALTAMSTFLETYDENVDRPDVSICHGLPGLILLCDTFDRHTGLEGAATLRDHLAGRLTDRLAEVAELSAQDNNTLLSGAAGACAALLTVYGGNRAWLPALGLR
ncbi:lanthionine synthetase LanC family protein [Nonomuraea sp. PA05]|uniref:lanthionine synthetase LanC family protein n=1 Tax=Nonomuraea sp. PA05 TaxID=2604466 RepID=UPI0016523C22|nr:lanthionine synthetase LanC family protein [Nonomuraea sp. PA05]